MSSTQELSPRAKQALREIRALRLLPDIEVVRIAEEKVIKKLNTIEALAVALEIQKDEEGHNG